MINSKKDYKFYLEADRMARDYPKKILYMGRYRIFKDKQKEFNMVCTIYIYINTNDIYIHRRYIQKYIIF